MFVLLAWVAPSLPQCVVHVRVRHIKTELYNIIKAVSVTPPPSYPTPCVYITFITAWGPTPNKMCCTILTSGHRSCYVFCFVSYFWFPQSTPFTIEYDTIAMSQIRRLWHLQRQCVGPYKGKLCCVGLYKGKMCQRPIYKQGMAYIQA